jgi:uncharacterized protein
MKNSRWTRAGAVMVGVAVAGSMLLTAAPAGAASRPGGIYTRGKAFDYRKLKKKLSKVQFKDSQIIREEFEVPMSAEEPTHPGMEVTMHVEVIRPKKVNPYATILELSPYHGTIADRNGARIFPGPKKANLPPWIDTSIYSATDRNLGLAGYFAPRGYAVVMADLRGTGQSTGCLDHLGPRDQKDSKDLINWIAKQKWSNGRVGMTGHSYVGSTPSMAAAQNPKALKTIVPSAGLAAMYHHKFQDGVPYFAQWVGPAEAYEELAINRFLLPQLGDAYGDNFGEDYEWFGCGLPNSAIISGDEYEAGVYDDAEPFPWDAERDSRKGATKSDIPVFAVHGVNDNAARIPALDWFHKHRNRHDKAWIGQWDHGSNLHPNDRTCAQHATVESCTNDQWTLALHAWFDKWLKQRKINTGPDIEVFLNNRTVYQPSDWPARRESNPKTFYLGPDGKLVTTKPKEATTASYVASPAGFGNEYSDEGELGANALGWTSKPMKRDILLAGLPTAKLFESQTVERLHIITTLYDIAPNGDVVCVQVTPKTASTTRCGISKGTFAMNPELRSGIKEITPVVPGETMKLNMKGMDQAWLLEKGHKLRVVVASSQPDKVPTHAEGTVTVNMGGDTASSVTVPVVSRGRLRTDTYHKG